MVEDKLTRGERRRLECIAQAIAFHTYKGETNAESIIETAKTFDTYIAGGNGPVIRDS